MHQARPRAWASLTQNPGAQLPQPGTQLLPQLFLQHRLLELRVVQDGDRRGPSNNGCQHICWLSVRSLPRQHNQTEGTPASRQDGTAGQPHHEGTWSVPAQHEPQGMQNVRRKCCTSTRPTEFTSIRPFPHNHDNTTSTLLPTPTLISSKLSLVPGFPSLSPPSSSCVWARARAAPTAGRRVLLMVSSGSNTI